MKPNTATVAPHVTIMVDGVLVQAAAGTSVAAAILNREAADMPAGRSPWTVRASVTGESRGPLCGMGICFECRATVDGLMHERTCQLPVRDGMEIHTHG